MKKVIMDPEENSFLTSAVKKSVDHEQVVDQASMRVLLSSTFLIPLSIIAKNAYMRSAVALLRVLYEKGVIYREDGRWKPAVEFADKQLFGYNIFSINSKRNGGTYKEIHTLKATFKGECFIHVLLSYPDLEARDAYLKTFMK